MPSDIEAINPADLDTFMDIAIETRRTSGVDLMPQIVFCRGTKPFMVYALTVDCGDNRVLQQQRVSGFIAAFNPDRVERRSVDARRQVAAGLCRRAGRRVRPQAQAR
jgi:hypothetical protein